VTHDDVDRNDKLHAYINKKQIEAGKEPTMFTTLITDEALALTIDCTRKELAKVAWALKKRYPADYKDYLKRLDEAAAWLTEHKHTNHTIWEFQCKVAQELRDHPVAKELKQTEVDRNQILLMFAENHKVAIFGGKTCIRREKENAWILPEQLRQFYSHLSVTTDDGKPQNIVSAFMDWDQAPRYSDVIFDSANPGHTDDYYNLWQGWTVEPEDGDDDACWWEVLEAACGYNLDYVEYVTKWFADIFQRPSRKPGTAIGISGKQGIGKSALVETVGMLLANINQHGNNRVITGAYGDFTLDELLADYNEHVAN